MEQMEIDGMCLLLDERQSLIHPPVARWLCTVLWSPPMITSTSGQISLGWRKPPNMPIALAIGALLAM